MILPGGRGGGEENTASGPCKGSPPQIDPRQFVAINKTVYQLITFAYPIGTCPYVFLTNRLQGGPDWSRTASFDIRALIPEGFPNSTWQQLRDGDAPKLQAMLRTLLEERFKLVIHGDMKEMSGYVLTLGKRPLKLMPSTVQGRGSSGMGPRIRDGQVTAGFNSNKISMGGLASRLELVTGAPVFDQTGVSGDFSVSIEFAPLDSRSSNFRVAGNTLPVSGPSIFTALEELGLELRSVREGTAVLVIDSVQRPSEN